MLPQNQSTYLLGQRQEDGCSAINTTLSFDVEMKHRHAFTKHNSVHAASDVVAKIFPKSGCIKSRTSRNGGLCAF